MVDVLFFQPISGFYERVSKQLPLGLLYASSILHKEGYKIRIIDQAVDPNWRSHLKDELVKKPLFFGTTCTTGSMISNALIASKLAHQYEIPVVWGGPHVTVLPKQTLQNEYVDIVVVGEGEKTTYELAKNIEKEKSLKTVRGIVYKDKNEGIHVTKERQLVNLDNLPFPPFNLVDYKKYSTFSSGKIFNLESSRGCPFSCTFCYLSSLKRERKWRAMSSKRTFEIMKLAVEKYGANGIDFVDHNFFVDTKRINKIVDLILENSLDIVWNSEGLRVDTAIKFSHQFIRDLERSGLRFVALGVESGSERILSLLNKGITRQQAISVNKKLAKHEFITPQYNFMVGIPSSNLKDWKKTTDLMLKLLNDNPRAYMQPLSPYLPYPGTKLFDTACNYGFIPPQKLEGWTDLIYPIWFSKIPWLTKKEKKLISTLYMSSLFIDRKAELRLYGGILPKLVKLFSQMYRPIAIFRLKHHFTSFAPELALMNSIYNM